MENSQLRRSPNEKKIKDKIFKLPIEESIKIIEEVRKIQKHSKTLKPDQNRKQYQELLQWVLTKLQASKNSVHSKKFHFDQQNIQIQNFLHEALEQQVQVQQRTIIQTLMQQMIEMFKRQCKQKSQLMQVCFSYFNQLINSFTKHYQNQLQQTFNTYNLALTQIQDQYEEKLVNCQKKLSNLQGEKQTKWKNIYMLAKDNRILRRQKGKLLRTAQQQDQKIKVLQEQLCQIAKENQMNKLIIRFQNDSENLKVFLKNRVAIMKFEKVLENYPKKAMKVLSNELLKLQIEQLNSLDSKIDYIKRVIIQSGDIFDQYEDMNQLVTKPNVMVFNMFSQTDPEDIQPPIETKDVFINTDPTRKRLKFSRQLYQINNFDFPFITQPTQSQSNQNNLSIKKISTSNLDKKKKFFYLQLCPQVFNQTLQINLKIKSNKFDIFHSIQINEKPKLKDKAKLSMMQSVKQKDSDSLKVNIISTGQTLKNVVKKQASTNRKSQILGHKNYAIINPLLNKNNFGRYSEQMKDHSTFLSFQNYADQSKKNETINDKSQISQILQSDIPQSDQKNVQDENKNQEILSKFKKNKRVSRRITEIIPFTFENDSISNDTQIVINNQKTNKIEGEKTHNQTGQISEKYKINQSPPNNKGQKGKNTLKKVSRVKTSQNFRKSSNQTRLLTDMGFIQEQQSQNEVHIQSKQQKFKVKNRFSQNQTLNIPKNFGFYNQSNNLNQFKQNHKNQFSDGQKKYRISINPADFDGKSKLSRFTSRNSSLNLNLRKRISQNNADTGSINSFFSNQNQQKINYKALMTEVKPKQTFVEGLESQFLDPICIKPYEVKKIVEKILKSMYIRRKELLSCQNSQCLKTYIEHFLKQLYGQKWKGQKNVLRYIFTVYDRDSSSNIRVFNLLMNTKAHVEYLEDLFRLYLTMIQKNEPSSTQNYLSCNKTKALSILKFLLSIYFDQETQSQVLHNLTIINNFEVDLNEIFIVVETQLKKYTMQTQFYHFLCQIIPQSQSNILFSQMKELLFLFKNQPNYHTHIVRLKYFFKIHGKSVSNQQSNLTNKVQNSKKIRNSKSQNSLLRKTSSKQQIIPQIQILPFHKVCHYLKRYQWKNVLEINTFIQEKYSQIVGVFIQEETIKFISKYCIKKTEKSLKNKTNLQSGILNISAQINKYQHKSKTHSLEWLLERSKQLIRNHYRYKSSIDRRLLMFVHLSIIMYELQMGMQEVISEPLNLLNMEYKRIKTKEQVDQFLKE